MSKWNAALAAAQARTGYAKLLCIGDSTTAGFGETQAKSWPALLAQRLNRMVPTQPGLSIPMTLGVDAARWTLGTQWQIVFDPGSSALYANAVAGTDTVFTPGINCDTADVWWFQGSGKGTFVVKIDGVAQTPIDTNGGSGHWQKTTYSFTAGMAHTIALQMPTVNPVDVLVVLS